MECEEQSVLEVALAADPTPSSDSESRLSSHPPADRIPTQPCSAFAMSRRSGGPISGKKIAGSV